DGTRTAYQDLNEALAGEAQELKKSELDDPSALAEWRIHFHVPLHSPPTALFGNTSDHLLGALDVLQANPNLCSHLEMETYTWEVLPPELKNRDVVTQLVAEYNWTLARLTDRGLYRP